MPASKTTKNTKKVRASSLSVQKVLAEAFNITKNNFSFLFSVIVIFAFYAIFRSLLSQSVAGTGFVAFIVNVATYIFQTILEIGLVKIALDITSGRKGDLHDLYKNYRLFINFFVGSIFYGIVVFVGFLLLIIPGIFFAVKYQFFSYLIVDKNMGPGEALSASAKLTDGKKWFIFLFDLAIIGINILGLLALIVGLIFTIPLSVIATTLLYKKLSS